MPAKRQAFNPYLPSYEYVPDGEPRVFGDRLYVYGSHDRFNGADYCLNDYVCWSAATSDLADWRYEGVIFRKDQDPVNAARDAMVAPRSEWAVRRSAEIAPSGAVELNPAGVHAMLAPDVTRGPDGRYYLYYFLDALPEIRVAVSDSPAGRFEYLGLVSHPDGTPLGTKDSDSAQFDPGVFVDDDRTVYLYSGFSPMRNGQTSPYGGSQVMTLRDDMLTLASTPRQLIPTVDDSQDTGFQGHEFFEASSMRKIDGKYYFIYSSVQSHDLCYAVSLRPDAGFSFGGVLIDNGDIGLHGRSPEQAVMTWGNTHGSIACVHDQWYVFYHRQTNRTDFSRQGCAERVTIAADGTIAQAEITSCGLNGGPLTGRGVYPARICCHLTGGAATTFSSYPLMQDRFPYLTQDLADVDPDGAEARRDEVAPVQYVRNFGDNATIGFKYFRFEKPDLVRIRARGRARGQIEVRTELQGAPCGAVRIDLDSRDWVELECTVTIADAVLPLYLTFTGHGAFDLATIEIA